MPIPIRFPVIPPRHALGLAIPMLLLIALLGGCMPAHDQGHLSLENERLIRTFAFTEQGPGPIRLSQHSKGQQAQAWLAPDMPYFECMIDGQRVSALDSLWTYDGHDQRDMGNGGTEYILRFRGVAAPVAGLSIAIYQQLFPGAPLIREKLTLSSTSDQVFHLTKTDGQLHFRYPAYAMAWSASSYSATEIRIASWEAQPPSFAAAQGKGAHMYFPDERTRTLGPEQAPDTVKGPMHWLSDGQRHWFSAYEHASQDGPEGLVKPASPSAGRLVDALQGVKGVFDFPIRAQEFTFLGFERNAEAAQVSVAMLALRGVYLDGEPIQAGRPFTTVWTASGFTEGSDLAQGQALIRDYLYRWICERPASRQPSFYYNTWGMQRAQAPDSLRAIMHEQHLIAEIDRAAEMGVDLFVLDDGWQQTMGRWTAHPERLPQGLAPLKAALDRHGMTMGIWLSPLGIDSTTAYYDAHRDWVIRDSEGQPVIGQWDHPMLDLVGPYYEPFVADCKRLIDQGARFFKWDAINTAFSDLPGLDHGDSTVSAAERRARYAYLLPIYVTRAMEELTAYEPELVIEIDLTEARRAMTGLALLSQGKYFWMNNGGSGYQDFGSLRTQYMRSIPNTYAGLIPLELFTYANYPHDAAGFQDYNVNTSLLAGHGYWGDLATMSPSERQAVGRATALAKRVLPYLGEVEPMVSGQVGDAPETYAMYNPSVGAGQLFAFSSKAGQYPYALALGTTPVLGLVDHPFERLGDSLQLTWSFAQPEASQRAFILPGTAAGPQLRASSAALNALSWEAQRLRYQPLGTGTQRIDWPAALGEPQWAEQPGLAILKKKVGATWQVTVQHERTLSIDLGAR